MNTKRKIGLVTVMIALCIALLCAAVPVNAAEKYCTSVEEAAQIVREAMVDREAEVTISYPIERAHLTEQEIMALLQGIYAKAIEHTGVGTEGDYLYFHEGEFRYGYGYEDDGVSSPVNCTLTFQFSYYTTAAQEAELTPAVNSLLASLNLSGKSDYEKVRAIYDYLCENITYDYTNLNNEAYTLKYSAYAAMTKGTSVCQGYANLFYRLANAAGLDARIVSGTSRGQAHAWNIVKVDGEYYNLDSTWDAGNRTYRYFLKGSANFDEHIPDGTHPSNYAAHNISVTDYVSETPIAPSEPQTEVPKPTETPTEALKTTEAPTEEPKPTEAPTEAPKPMETPTEAPKPTETPTEAPKSTEAPTGTTKTTEASTEISKPTDVRTDADDVAESTTEVEASAETTTEAEESIETATEPGEGTETTAGTETATDEPSDDAAGNVIYIILGVAGIAVAGTAIGSGVVIYRKRK